SSRTWRWSRPFRTALDTVGRPASRLLEVCLESSTTDSTTLGGLEVTGWAFHRESRVKRVEIAIRGGAPIPVEFGIERPDVAAAFPACDVGRPGFRALTHALEDPVTLEIVILRADGGVERLRRRLHRTAAMNARAREIYGAP